MLDNKLLSIIQNTYAIIGMYSCRMTFFPSKPVWSVNWEIMLSTKLGAFSSFLSYKVLVDFYHFSSWKKNNELSIIICRSTGGIFERVFSFKIIYRYEFHFGMKYCPYYPGMAGYLQLTNSLLLFIKSIPNFMISQYAVGCHFVSVCGNLVWGNLPQ